MLDQVIHIVYASDNNFVQVLGVSVVSLFENNRDADIQVYILDHDISTANKSKVESICRKYKKKLPSWVEVSKITTILGMDVRTDRGSLSQYARLFISSHLPEHIKRVLYLDCDTIINQSLDELWNMKLHGRTIAALRDAFSPYYRKNIGLKPKDIMFNSGVMLIDLEKWKEKGIENKLLDFIRSRNGRIQQGDQGALNAILHNTVECFAPRFNSVTIFYDFTYENMLVYRKPQEFYSKEDIKEAVEHPVIIHYTTSFLSRRPWVEGSQHRYRNQWMYYKAISPWKEEPLIKPKECGWKKLYVKFYKKMPVKFSVRLAGIFQAYGRPVMNRFKNGVF